MMKNTLMALALGTALLAPAVVVAQPPPPEHPNRYYDRGHKDYHEWNAGEDRAYHRYWEDQHHAYIDWARASARQREAYWAWRHNHSDQALFQVNIR